MTWLLLLWSLAACEGTALQDLPAIAADFVLPGPPPIPPPGEPVYRRLSVGDTETWATEDGRTATFQPKRRLLTRSEAPDAPVKTTRRWREWDALLLCLGPPMADPPAGDPDAFRKLVWKDKPLWVLQLSGTNRCAASGVVTMEASGQKVDVSKLLIDGVPWQRGGRERAKELGMGHVQISAVDWWLQGSDEEREILLRALRDDPDPASLAALQRILAVAGPAEAPLVLSAIEHRPTAGPEAPQR